MIGWAVMAAVAIATGGQGAAPASTAESERLGRQLAETGTLAALMPLMVAKETEDLVKDHPDLSPAEQADLRRIAAAAGARPRAIQAA